MIDETTLSKNNQRLLIAYRKGYRALRDGSVVGIKGKVLKLYMDNNRGYLRFSIKNDTINVHRLVAYQKFGDKIFERGIQVRHLDNNKLNNKWENIGIGTQSENMCDIPAEERRSHAILASLHIRRFTIKEMEELRDMYRRTGSYTEVMNRFGISSKGTLHYMLNTKYATMGEK